MTRIKALLAAAIALCLVALGAVVAMPASAHTPKVKATCDVLSIELTNYNTGGTNHVKVTIDGQVVEDVDFGSSYVDSFEPSAPFQDWSYTVEVTAHDDPSGSKGWTRTFTDTVKGCNPPGGGHTPVNVCHATSSDTNPYVFITVDANSTRFQGHLAHRNTPNKTWKSDGVWRGQIVRAGDPKPDLIGDYTENGVFHQYDGVIDDKTDCGILKPIEEPKGSFTTECTPTGAQADIGTLTEGSYTGGSFKLVWSGGSVAVTSGQQNVTVPPETEIRLVYVSKSGAETELDKKTSQKACPPPVEEPSGSFTTECTATAARADVGTLDEGTFTGGTFRLVWSGGSVAVTTGQQDVDVPASETITLEYVPAQGQPVQLDSEQSPAACPPVVPPSGSFTTECTATGARADVGTLSQGSASGGTFRLVWADGSVAVTSGQQDVAVPASTAIELKYVPVEGQPVQLDSEQSPAACPPVVPPSGSFTTECTATGARADVGALTQGSASGGTFRLVSGTFSQTVTSGQQDVTVPASATVKLEYVPVEGQATELDSEQSPAACPSPPPPTGDIVKTSVPVTGTVVAPGQRIDYTVTVTNTGQVPITNSPVVDTLPTYVTAVPGTVSDSGVVSPDGRTITWTVSLAPGASKAFTYQGLVATNAPAGASLVNKATFLLKESTTTHTVGSRGLGVVKSVAPTGTVEFGDTLTYSLTVTATGNLPQTNVVVTDPVPAGTTYTAGSATCDTAGPCSPSVANGVVTWALGPMAAGGSRTVSFQVTVDTPEADEDGAIPAVTVLNAGAASSAEVPTTPSNEVETPVTAVLPEKTGPNPPGGGGGDDEVPAGPTDTGVLPQTGSGLPAPWLGGMAALLVLMGLAMVSVARPRAARRKE